MNILTTELLKLIDKQRPAKPSPDTILQAPANMYGIIRQMYNSFKKDNQSRILQNKVYELKIYQSRRDSSSTKTKKEQPTPVKLQHLFQSSTKNHTAQIIHNLMILKSFLELDLKIELIQKISKEVSKLDDLTTVLKLYKKLLKAKECINDKKLYKLIQREMIVKVLSLTSCISITKQNMTQISIFLLSLPFLQIQVLQLISSLFEKIKEISDFDALKLIYNNIYKKVSEKEKIQNQQNKIIMQSLLKITSQEHINIVRQKANSLIDKKKNKSKLTDQAQIFLKLLQQQSIKYMVSNYPILKINASSEVGSGSMEEQNLNEKEKKIIDLIFVALETQSLIELVSEGRNNTKIETQREKWNEKLPVLNIFIGWYHNCCKNSTWDAYLSEKMIQFTSKLFQFPHSVISLIKILLEREAGSNINSDNISSTIVNLNQSVSKFIIGQLLSNLSVFNRYLNNKHAKQIVAYGLMNDQFDIYEQIIINPSNLDYIDILLETFNCPSPIDFYKKILGNQIKRANFQKYLSALLQQKQKKYKDFFKQVDSYHEGQIFEIHQHCLLKFFRLTATSDIVLGFFRDMTLYLPSKLCIEIMKSFIQKFKPKGDHKIIYSQAVRTLNIILSTRNASELSVQFKMHLKQIVQLQIIQAKQVFKNVPIKMTDDLTLFYTSSQAK